VFTSIREPGGLEPLKSEILRRLRRQRPTVVVEIPVTNGRTLAEAYEETEILDRTDGETAVTLRARVPAEILGRWRGSSDVKVTEVEPA
jgi:50S ribosomal subunit-associated GTPase HflX